MVLTGNKYLKRTKKTYKKRYVKRSKKYGVSTKLARAIKSIALRNCETKHYQINLENLALYHNGCVTPITNCLQVYQGNTQTTRIGDEVYIKGVAFKFFFYNPPDRPNTSIRLIFFTSEYRETDTAMKWSAGTSPNLMLGVIDTDKINIIHQKVLRPLSGDYSLESGASNKEHGRYYSYYLKVNRKVKYYTDTGGGPKNARDFVNVAMVVYDTYSTSVLDIVCRMSFNSIMYFKDP